MINIIFYGDNDHILLKRNKSLTQVQLISTSPVFQIEMSVLSQDVDMSQVYKNLYIGGIEAAEVSVDLGFSSVLTLDTVLPSSTPALV